MAASFLKLISQSPIQSFLKIASSPLQIFQVHAQSFTNPKFSHPSNSSCLLYALTQLSCSCLFYSYINLVFSRIESPDTFIYNTIIRCYSKIPKPHLSIEFFARMRRHGIKTDNYSYPFVLKASSLICNQKVVMVIHCDVLKNGFENDVFVSNGLISSYCKSGEIALARQIFDTFLYKDLVSWNSMMNGYVNSENLAEAQKLFDEMPKRDAFSWAIMIDAYCKIGNNVCRARELFDQASEKDLVCWNSMIDAYSKIGDMSSSQELFDAMPYKNVISWSIMIDGYVRHGNPKLSLELFHCMLQYVRPDRVSVIGAITTCAQLGALDQGQWIHSYLKKHKISIDVVVLTALIDMYMKCGNLDIAKKLFEGMGEKSVVSWNVMIVGLGTNGHGLEAINVFYQMEKEGAIMDDLTFLAVLSACTHSGLVAQGLHIFDKMKNIYKIEPKVEHYGCVVDLLGRAGRLEEARQLLETMPMEPTPALLGSLLASCKTHRSIDLAENLVERLACIGADDSGVYVLMSNIYADEGMWEHVSKMRKLVREKGMTKETGRSTIEVNGIVHEFVNGDSMHCCKERIFAIIWNLSKEMVSSK